MSDEEKPKEEPKQEDEKWSKEKQRADQAESNFRKKNTENEQLTAQLTESGEKYVALEQKLADLAESKDVPVEDLLDPDLVDAKTIKTVSKMMGRIKKLEQSNEKLQKTADGYQEKEEKKRAKTEKDKTIDEILGMCDEEFGAKYRKPAKKMADKLVDDGTESQPKTIVSALKLMRKCYVEVKAKAEKKEEKKVQTDNGTSSFSLDASVPKTGSRRDILASMRKTGLNLFGKS